jgi:hypothetical protein
MLPQEARKMRAGSRSTIFRALLPVVRSSLAGALLVAAVFGGKPAAAQAIAVDLLINPNINTNLGGWNIFGNVTFDGMDDQGGLAPASGSAMAAEKPGQTAAILQCVNLPVFWRSVTFRLDYWTKPVTPNGASLAQVEYFDAANCGGQLLSQVQQESPVTSSDWQQVSFLGLNPPELAQSAGVLFRAANTDPSTSATVLLDSFFFGYFLVGGNVCGADPSLLCVNHDRFQITADFVPKCNTGSNFADGVQDTESGGFLWCFDPTNPELFVKILNACTPGTGNTYWVFIAGLTNVGVTVTVTDTQTHQHKSYTSHPNVNFVPIFDTSGLKVCP